MFNNLNKPAFGTTPTNTSMGFGATNPTNAYSFGQNQSSIFGKPTTGFGTNTSTFGQPQTNTLFPSAQPNNTLFQNANTGFGVQSTAQPTFGGGLFGQQQPSTSGLFGGTTSTFGQQSKPTGFGFGQPQQQTGLFGQQTPTASSSLFQNTGGTLFGGGASTFGGSQQTGTTIKFNPVTGTDTMMKGGVAQSINTKHHSITCMKEYEAKSFEELRFEDYQANRKGPQATGFGASPFGAPASSAPSLFGQTDPSKPAFGAATNTFGQTTSSFGQNTGFGLGATQPASGGLFGKPTGFGAPTSSTSSFGLNTAQNTSVFGSTAQTKPFGASQPIFGAATSTAPQTNFGTGSGLFGQTNNQSTGLFGKPAQTGFGQTAQPSIFSQPASQSQPQSLFQANKPFFGQTNTSTSFGTGSTFGQTTTPSFGTGGFGKPAAPAFGQATGTTGFGTLGMNQPSTGLFGNTAAKPGGLFGNTGSGLFGGTNTGLGTDQGLFGSQQQQQSLFPSQQEDYKNLALLTTDAFGDSPHLAGLEPKIKQAAITTNPAELKSILDSSKKVDVTPGNKLKITPINRKESLFDGLDKSNTDQTPTYQKSSHRRLILKKRPEQENSLREDVMSKILSPEKSEKPKETSFIKALKEADNVNPIKLNFETLQEKSEEKVGNEESRDSLNGISVDVDVEEVGAGDTMRHPCGIVCTRPDYYTLPSAEALSQYVNDNGSCFVKGFTIGRKGYGNVFFPEEMDVSNLNIDQLVQFRYREINVYPDDSKKPPVGQGLNRRAQVTLDNVFPKRIGTNTLIKDVNELLQMNFAEKLRKITVKKNARFVDYRPETGSWVFKVEHFSRYGYNDSDDDLENDKEVKETRIEKLKPKEIEKPDDRFVLGLDKDILIEDEEHSSEDDLLHHSMFMDIQDEFELPRPKGLFQEKTSRNIQVMKSTLFGDDDRSSDGGSHTSIIRQYLDIPEELPKLAPIREEVPKKKQILRPKVCQVYNYGGVGEPALILPSRCTLDLAVFKGKSFRVGWNKGFDFVGLSGDLGWEVVVNRIPDDLEWFQGIEGFLDEALGNVLQQSCCVLDEEGVPCFKVVKGLKYLEVQTELFKRVAESGGRGAGYLYSVWTLCSALWGDGEGNGCSRRYLFSEWLKTNCSNGEIYEKSVNSQPINKKLQNIFDLLSVFKVYEAANLAMENKMPGLSLIISQLCLTNRVKILMQQQIDDWYNSLAANHISRDMKRIYLLLSGIPSKEDVNVFEDIDWKRAAGMHLWYMVPNSANIESAIELYKNAFENVGYAEKPLPPYSFNAEYSEENSFDVLYHILLLYKSRIHRLSSVLNPATHTKDPLDYRLSWLLLQLFLSLEVGLVEEAEKIKITVSFSNQLEALGSWEWAIFVLLHLEDNKTKKVMIMRILERNISLEVDQENLDAQNNLVNNMKLPPVWIHLVKGQKAELLGRYFEAFNHFALAEDYCKANDILVEHLLPNLFINEQYEIIRELVGMIKKGSASILKYNSEAGLFEDFINLYEEVFSFRLDDLVKLQMKLVGLSERLTGFPQNNDQQKLCIAEMSKRCASLFKELIRKCKNSSYQSPYTILLDNLLLPSDFIHNEAVYLINNQ